MQPPCAQVPCAVHTILVVEDEILIAIDLAMQLKDRGHEVLGPASTVSAALVLLEDHHPAAAILDVNLRGELVTPVAMELRRQHVPFVLSSATSTGVLGENFEEVKNFGKPLTENSLRAALHEMLPCCC